MKPAAIATVAIPLVDESVVLTVSKGRLWTPIEHAILVGLKRGCATAGDIAVQGDLPKPLVLMALNRLMRAGWVEIHVYDSRPSFQLSASGTHAATWDTLPRLARRITREFYFVFELITGQAFRHKEFGQLVWRHQLDESWTVLPQLHELEEFFDESIFETWLNFDEELETCDYVPSGRQERFAIVRVTSGTVVGLPESASQEMREAITNFAASQNSKPSRPPSLKVRTSRNQVQEFAVRFRERDLVTGGKAHQQLFQEYLMTARKQLVIHSTFLSVEGLRDIVPALAAGAKKGLQVEILWGQEPERDGEPTKTNVDEYRSLLREYSLDSNVRVHPISTGSHAKFLLADAPDGRIRLTIGSCNWLASRFNKFETSAQFRDPRFVASFMRVFAGLLRGGHIELEEEFHRGLLEVSRQLGTRFPSDSNPNARVRLLLGSMHQETLLRSIDSARSSWLCVSHRIGPKAENAVLVPLTSKRVRKGLDRHLYFEGLAGGYSSRECQILTSRYRQAGLRITRAERKTLHGKFVAWDEDDAVITSQNWLSCVPELESSSQEIGVHIRGAGVGRTLTDRFHRHSAELARKRTDSA